MPIIGMPGYLEKPFCAPVISVFGQKEYLNFRFGPSYRSLLSKPNFSALNGFRGRSISIS
ncbi:CHS_3a_G0038660.mRNA.1.CDS.1 [Saccharomyces cerevisiae]|nr:ACA_G0039750.mRNA.1.CDS.1 [Saccharomyces cerevisiae]CAI4893003.1 CHS_3a_G0038660.mRNA.1.CDS.1 [Saccharomyces cerevisiae]CAI6437972.1 CBM_HP1_G0009860.mRNA.1.CDS.1 [Saccharomyces cerevisiae]CAI6831514.1 ACA_G0039750.mRNA.1.CDS.1 [Saccharomyces cerevisiae]CAI7416723.1 CHS_3a_G0038660.mRNA.1.CDS.1 [Saccharomyces cerevisiae]